MDGCILVDGEMQRNVSGVFAAGDMLCRHIKQAVIAGAEKDLRGRAKLHLDWQ